MNKATYIKVLLAEMAEQAPPAKAVFFKTQIGDYAEHDQFIGVPVPSLRKVAKQFLELPLTELQFLLESPINEERMLALVILVYRFQKAPDAGKSHLYDFYVNNLKYVNNWNLVDSSAHLIMGDYLYTKEKDILLTLAKSDNLWERRIAVVATWHFIRQGSYEWTIKIAEVLLKDSHDLIHKAVGWMLREMGKKNLSVLKEFLNQHGACMPRTMLRYAIEKFSEEERKAYLNKPGKIK